MIFFFMCTLSLICHVFYTCFRYNDDLCEIQKIIFVHVIKLALVILLSLGLVSLPNADLQQGAGFSYQGSYSVLRGSFQTSMLICDYGRLFQTSLYLSRKTIVVIVCHYVFCKPEWGLASTFSGVVLLNSIDFGFSLYYCIGKQQVICHIAIF